MPTYPWVQYLPLCMKLRYCLLKIATSLLNPHCFAPDGYQPWRTDCRFNCCWMILPTKSLIRAPSQPCHKLPELLRIGELPPHFFTVGTSSRQHSTKITVPLQPTYFCFHNNIDFGLHLVRYLVDSFWFWSSGEGFKVWILTFKKHVFSCLRGYQGSFGFKRQQRYAASLTVVGVFQVWAAIQIPPSWLSVTVTLSVLMLIPRSEPTVTWARDTLRGVWGPSSTNITGGGDVDDAIYIIIILY